MYLYPAVPETRPEASGGIQDYMLKGLHDSEEKTWIGYIKME